MFSNDEWNTKQVPDEWTVANDNMTGSVALMKWEKLLDTANAIRLAPWMADEYMCVCIILFVISFTDEPKEVRTRMWQMDAKVV